MHPIHDADILLLQAITQASKRRPAELEEVMTAALMLQSHLPSEVKMGEAFKRLQTSGLILAQGTGYRLSPEAEKIMAALPKKSLPAEKISRIKEQLNEYHPAQADLPAVIPQPAELSAAIAASRLANPELGPDPLEEQKKATPRYKHKTPWRPGLRSQPKD